MNFGARYLRAPPLTLRQTSDGNATYPGRTNCAKMIAATAYLAQMGAQAARPCLSTTNGHDQYGGNGLLVWRRERREARTDGARQWRAICESTHALNQRRATRARTLDGYGEARLLLNDAERPGTPSCLSWGLCSIRWRILGYSKRAHHVCAL